MSNRKRTLSYRPWGSTEDGAIEFESLTSTTLEGALNVIRESFFPEESVCLGCDIQSEPGASEELEQLCMYTAKDGVSVVAIDVKTMEVVGVAFNKLHKRLAADQRGFFEEFSENCKHKASKFLVDFMISVDAKVNLFKHYNVDCILEIMFLATKPSFQKRRIGELLVSSSLELGRQLYKGMPVKTEVEIDELPLTNADAVPSLVSAIMTSKYSQKISQKIGFDNLAEVSYDEYTFAGKKASKRIGNFHKTARLKATTILLLAVKNSAKELCMAPKLPNGKIVYKILSEDKVEAALEVQQKSMCDENVAIGVGLYEEENAPESMECVFREVIKDNCTITKAQEDEPNFFVEIVESHIKSGPALALIQFIDEVESKVNIFEKYNASAAMEIFYIGTHPNYRGRRIGQEILGASIALAAELKDPINGSKVKPEAIFGVFTSNYSQKLAEYHHFEWLSTVDYSDFEFFGKKMSDRIKSSEHKTSKLGARSI
ncbi:GSCOCG00013528001-RA-CDS [Cotesia congregata]|nr:GSCOCG00013528001-RA-CDS [Cotesia congregata]